MALPSFQRLALMSLLSLPAPVLRLLAGGGVTYVGGRTLDPRFQLLAALAAREPSITAMTPEEARRSDARALRAVCGRPEPGVRSETFSAPGSREDLAARIYRPKDQDPQAPVMVYAHPGGGVIGDLESCDAFCRIIARIVRCPVVSVAYGLAPERRFPEGLEDMVAAYLWVRDNAERFGAASGLASVGGDAIGGAIATAIAQELKRRGEVQPVLQLLLYPAVDVASETASMTTYADAFPLSRALIDWFTGHYVGPQADPADPRLSPLREPDLAGLAPTILVTAGFDPLLDQGAAYALRLREAGVPTVYRCYDSLAHGFAGFTGAVPRADAACREIAGLARDALAGGIA